jgi:hypothetical protein
MTARNKTSGGIELVDGIRRESWCGERTVVFDVLSCRSVIGFG